MTDLDQVAREALAAQYKASGYAGVAEAILRDDEAYREEFAPALSAIKAAILAERERCAAIAQAEYLKQARVVIETEGDSDECAHGCTVAGDIRNAIRSQSTPTEEKL
jgi:hypothetical protein